MTKKQIAVLYMAMATSFATTFMGSSLNLSVPSIGKEMMVSASQLGFVVTSYILVMAAFAVPFGRMGDQTGRKKLLVAGLMLFAITSLFSAFSDDFPHLILLRAIQGISAAMIFSSNMPILLSNFPFSMRGRVLGLSTAATYAGLSLGPVLGGIMNHYLGWRSIFVATFIFTLPALIVAMSALPKDDVENFRENKNLFDIPGNVLYVMTILSLIYGFTVVKDNSFAGFLILLGVLSFFAFVTTEKKAENPLIKVTLFTQNRTFAFSNIAAMLNYGATFAIGYLLSIYLQVIMGYSSQAAGLIMIAQPIIMMVLSPISGRMSDKVSACRLASIGMAFCALGLVFFVFIDENTHLAFIIAGLAVTGIGFGFFSSPNTNAVMSSVGAEEHGVASSVLTTMRSVGHASGMAMVTVIMATYMGKQALTEVPQSLLVFVIQRIFLICIIVCVLGIFFSLGRIKDKSNPKC